MSCLDFLDHLPLIDGYADGYAKYIGFAYSNPGAHGMRQSSFEVRDGDMSEVRLFAEVVNAVRTRTLSAMGKGQTETTSGYENDAKAITSEMNASMTWSRRPSIQVS